MIKSFLCLGTIWALALCSFAQAPTPAPTPKPAEISDNDVVRISTNLIQLDVTVTDKKGKVVTDLQPHEIEIFENGEKQSITNFSFMTSVRQREEQAVIDKNAVPLPSTVLRSENVRRTIALIVDDLSLSFPSAYSTQRALRKFVDEQMQPGDLVAIIRTGAGVGALQQFTSDKRMLYAAIERVRWNPIGNGGVGVFAPIGPQTEIRSPTEPTDLGNTSGAESEFENSRQDYFAVGTLGAIDFVIRGMAELPGRKAVVLFSDGFPMRRTNARGFTEGSNIIDPMKRLIDSANRSAVVIYAIDPRGLVVPGLSAEDSPSGSPDQIAGQIAARSETLFESQSSLRYLARETGGFAVVNSNDIVGGVRRVMDDQSYYLLGYEPDSDTFDPVKRRFNKIEVKVLRPGLSVRYRSGFFNFADRPQTSAASSTGLTAERRLQRSIISPFSVNGINLSLNALFADNPKTGPFVRSILHVDAADMKFSETPDKMKKASFEIMAISFGDNGQIVDQLYKSFVLTLQPAVFEKVMANGFVYHFAFPVKKPGAYQYRVALLDSNGGAIGSANQFIEIPNLKKKRLTLSSAVLESFSANDWKRIQTDSSAQVPSDPMRDTSLRRFKAGSILRYALEVYNAKIDRAGKANLSSNIRLFRDGKLFLDGEEKPLKESSVSGAISLGTEMRPGDYILQFVVTEQQSGSKKKIATQFVQFEVVK